MHGIYVKDDVLHFLPTLFRSYTPNLFAEKGIMPTHDLQHTKSCVLLINICGIYFFRPLKKFSKQFKLAHFISMYDLESITYNAEKNKCDLAYTDSTFFMQCPHVTEAVSFILSARKLLYFPKPELDKLQLLGFPTQPVNIEYPFLNAQLVTLLYISRFARVDYNTTHLDLSIINMFNSFDHQHRDILTFDSTSIAPFDFKVFISPLCYMKVLKTICFNNFAPYCICRLVHFLLKADISIKTFVFDGYTTLIPTQLRLDKVEPKCMLSFIFKNCTLSEEASIELFSQFSKFTGELQRFSFCRFKFTLNSWKALFSAFSAKSFSTLEVVEIDELSNSVLPDDLVLESIRSLLTYCRFIMYLSVSHPIQPISFNLTTFKNISLLSCLKLTGQKLTEVLPDTFKFAKMINLLDLSQCQFTGESLLSIFKQLSIANPKYALSLKLANLRMTEQDWTDFYEGLQGLGSLPCIKELDFSGNPNLLNHIDEFGQFFLTSTSLKFLSIDKIFGPSTIEKMQDLLKYLPEKQLQGISIRGDIDHNFSSTFAVLARVLETLKDLRILLLDGNKFTDSDIFAIGSYLRDANTLYEVSFDDTAISNQEHFYEFFNNAIFYNNYFDSVGRPDKDIARLFGPRLENLSDTGKFEKFRAALRQKSYPMWELGRSFFLTKFHNSDEFDNYKYSSFNQKFPEVFRDYNFTDPFILRRDIVKKRMPTLSAFAVQYSVRSLALIHERYLNPPDKIPRYAARTQFKIPEILHNEYGTEQFYYLNSEQNTKHADDFLTSGVGFETFSRGGLFSSGIFSSPDNSSKTNSPSPITSGLNNSLESIDANSNPPPVEAQESEIQQQVTRRSQILNLVQSMPHYIDIELYDEVEVISADFDYRLVKIAEKGNSQNIICALITEDLSEYTVEEIGNLLQKIDPYIQKQYGSMALIKGYCPFDLADHEQLVVFLDYYRNGTLKDVNGLAKINSQLNMWDDTHKLINLYGIASAMAFLHSQDIIHEDLKTSNVLMDGYLFPRLANVWNKELKTGHQEVKGNPIYTAPEFYETLTFTKETDVYAFAIVAYEIMTSKIPLSDLEFSEIIHKFKNEEYRPPLDDVPEAYRSLIDQCWATNPIQRPTFEQIAAQLQSDESFITYNVNQELFRYYVEYIEQYTRIWHTQLRELEFKEIMPDDSSVSVVLDVTGIPHEDRDVLNSISKMRAASSDKNSRAINQLHEIYKNGLGLEPNQEEADRLYSLLQQPKKRVTIDLPQDYQPANQYKPPSNQYQAPPNQIPPPISQLPPPISQLPPLNPIPVLNPYPIGDPNPEEAPFLQPEPIGTFESIANASLTVTPIDSPEILHPLAEPNFPADGSNNEPEGGDFPGQALQY